MSLVLSLYRLQQTDNAIGRTLARLEAIQQELDDNAELKALSQTAEERRKEHLAAERALRQVEQAVEQLRIKIEQVEGNLYNGTVRNPKELQDLERELASLKRQLTALEEQELEAMIRLEEAESAKAASDRALIETQAQWQVKIQTLEEEQANLQKEMEKHRAEQKAILATVPPDQQKLYHQLRQQRRGVAVTTISENSCAACGAILSPALQQAVRSGNQVTLCPSCGRILYGH